MAGFGVGCRAIDVGWIGWLCGPWHVMSMTLNICSWPKFYEHLFWTYVHSLI